MNDNEFKCKRHDILRSAGNEFKPADFIWDGFKVGTFGALVAPGGTGKSFWALEAAIAVASAPRSECDLLGLKPKTAGRVVIIALEDDTDAFNFRLHALFQHLSPDIPKLLERNIDILYPERLDIGDKKHLDGMIDQSRGARLLIIDPLARSHGFDEKDNRQMAILLQRFQGIIAQTGCSILFIHHTTKASIYDGRLEDQTASRGGSVLVTTVRWNAYLRNMTELESGVLGIPSEDATNYVKFGVNKVNMGRTTCTWYRRSDTGILRQDPQLSERLMRFKPKRKAGKGNWRNK